MALDLDHVLLDTDAVHRVVAITFAVSLAGLSACGTDAGRSASTTATTTLQTTTPPTVPSTTTGATSSSSPPTTPASTATPTTTQTPSTSTTCSQAGDTGPQQSTDFLAMSGLVGNDIRTGTHPCFERVVIELHGQGDFPGWKVEYQTDPIVLGESNEGADIRGDATLVARLGAWMGTPEGDGYLGPNQLVPDNVGHILELRLVGNDEGVMRWAIGLDQQRSFVVTELTSPPRLVIDISTAD